MFNKDLARRLTLEKYPQYKDVKSWLEKYEKRKNELQKRLSSESSLKEHARKKVFVALRNKSLLAQPCTICGKNKSEAHHEDYSKPLEVIWLCKRHHTNADVKRRKRLWITLVDISKRKEYHIRRDKQ